jgi:hypothetical protein
MLGGFYYLDDACVGSVAPLEILRQRMDIEYITILAGRSTIDNRSNRTLTHSTTIRLRLRYTNIF